MSGRNEDNHIVKELDNTIETLGKILDRQLGLERKEALKVAIKHLASLRAALDDTPKVKTKKVLVSAGMAPGLEKYQDVAIGDEDD